MEEIEELEIKKEVLIERLRKVQDEIREATEERNLRLIREYESKATHNVFKVGQFVRNKKEKYILKVVEMLDKGYFTGLDIEYRWGASRYANYKHRSDDYEIIEDAFYYKNHTLQLELTPWDILMLKRNLISNISNKTYNEIYEWICKIQKEK